MVLLLGPPALLSLGLLASLLGLPAPSVLPGPLPPLLGLLMSLRSSLLGLPAPSVLPGPLPPLLGPLTEYLLLGAMALLLVGPLVPLLGPLGRLACPVLARGLMLRVWLVCFPRICWLGVWLMGSWRLGWCWSAGVSLGWLR